MIVNHFKEAVEREATELAFANDSMYPTDLTAPGGFYPPDYFMPPLPFSRNLIHQMYHLHKWQEVTGRKVADLNSIVEFGGGYGAMALVARRLGFKGKYTIIDLPEFLLLQEYFLSNTTDASTNGLGSYLFSRQLLSGLKDPAANLLIAGYSLSETDYAERDQFLWNYPANSYLLWYSNRFVDYENITYFQDRLPSLLPALTWKHWRIAHMPPESWYSVGYKP